MKQISKAVRYTMFPAVAATGLLLTGCESGQSGYSKSMVTTQEMQQGMTPDMVLKDLKKGNDRFVQGKSKNYDYLAQARDTAAGQYPKAIVLGCLDSRVPPEVVFDQGIGDIFVGRVAGNFENTDMLGSMEFGTALAGSKLIVVLGHESCGAVKGAIDQAEMGNLTDTLANINVNTSGVPGPRSSKNTELVESVTKANVRQTVRDIKSRSSVMSDLVERGELKVVGAMYDLDTGRVTWLD
ncbi:MAG: hypothetical protein JJ974_10960 [Phycisphaerales bacterium]|nr:hypothetical protein [Phycisphaerales bacterium]